MNSFVLSALIRTGVIEAIGAGNATPDAIAQACGVHRDVLRRTLRYASQLDLVSAQGDHFTLTEVGRCFLKDSPGSLYGSASFIGAPPWRDSWIAFEHCLRTGGPAFDHVFKQPFFQFLASNEEYGKPFDRYMTAMSAGMAPAIVEAYDFSPHATICDVGGGQGILLKAILSRTPAAKGILFDMATTTTSNVLGEVSDRVSIVNGSFFDPLPIADLMVLKTVIHDWNDEDSIRILSRCRESLRPGGKILLVEQVVEEPFTQFALFYDLHMQVMLGGAERTAQEFDELFRRAGLKLGRILPTKSPMKIIEAVL